MKIIQFQIGRKQLIEKLNVLHTKYSNEFDVLFKPSINKLTEPWVIAKWYIEAIESFKKEKDLEDNIVQFITKKVNSSLILFCSACAFALFSVICMSIHHRV